MVMLYNQDVDRKRLLVLAQLPPPVHGVTVISKQLSTSSLLNRDFDVIVLPMRFAAQIEQIDNFNIRKLAKSIVLACRLGYTCIRCRPNLIYFTLTPTGMAFYRDLVYVAIIKATGNRPVYHLHGIGIREAASSGFRRALYRWAFKNAWIIQLSERLYGDIEVVVPRENCRFLPNGIADPVSAPPVIRDDRTGPIKIAFLSHMIIPKGPIVLMQALVRLQEEGVRFSATFAGGRYSRDCRKQFENLLATNGLSDRVRYMGEVHGAHKDKMLRESDVFVFPSLYDAFGLVVLEAMAYGLPVVATIQGAIPDMVTDGVNGYLVPKNDPIALATSIRRLAHDEQLRVRMGEAARKRYEEYFTLDRFERDSVRLLTELARNRPSSSH